MKKMITIKKKGIKSRIKAIITSCMFAVDKKGNTYGKEVFETETKKREMTDYYTFRRTGFSIKLAEQQSISYATRIKNNFN